MESLKITPRSDIFKSSLKHAKSVFVIEKQASKSGQPKKSHQARTSDAAELAEIAKYFKTVICHGDDEESDWNSMTENGDQWLWKSADLKTLRASAFATRENRAIAKEAREPGPKTDLDKPVRSNSI